MGDRRHREGAPKKSNLVALFCRGDRALPVIPPLLSKSASVSKQQQLTVLQRTLNHWVLGSIPTRCMIQRRGLQIEVLGHVSCRALWQKKSVWDTRV